MPKKPKIMTDHKWKQFKYRYEVPEKVLRSQFDYLDEDEGFDGFFNYKGHWYHLSEFMRIHPDSEMFDGWDGNAPDSYFSGVLIKLSDDGEEYVIGTYLG